MDAAAPRLGEARAAYARNDWRAAYTAYVEVREQAGLEVDDLHALGEAAWWLGLIRETLEICEECHERFLAAGQPERAAMLAVEAAFNWMLRGQPEIGSGWLSRARRLLDELPLCLGHGLLEWIAVNERAAAGDVDGALAGARRLRELGGTLDEPVLSCVSLALEGELAVRAGDTERGFGLLDEAMLPVLAGRITPDWAGNLYCQMMAICHHVADLSRARQWTAATERWCDQFTSAAMFVGICRVHRAQLLRLEGAWDEAARQAALAAAELAELNVEVVAEAEYEAGEIARLRGDLARAHDHYRRAQSLGRRPEPGASLALLAGGRADDADHLLRGALGEIQDPFVRARLLRAHSDVALARGDVDAASAAASELRDLATTYRTAGFQAWAESARGIAELVGGQGQSALQPLRLARTCYRSMGATYDVAVTSLLLAEALRVVGDDNVAAVEAEGARAILSSLGAADPAGVPRAGRQADPPGGLTAREAEILVAVGEGLSNREVAARLVISEKTVARHLANIYAKLDVGSRTAAIAWAHREGLLHPA